MIMLKALNQWCFPAGTSLEDVFSISQEAGFTAVELNLNDDGDVGLTMQTTDEEALEIKAMAESYGLKLRSLSTALLWKYPLCAEDAEVRAKGSAVVQKQIELASVMGMDTILVVPGAVTDAVPYDACYERSQEMLKPLLKIAEEKDVFIGIENVWNKFLMSPLELARYVDELDSPKAAVYFDVGNVLQFGFPEQWIRILGSRIAKIHVKDFKTSTGNITGFVSLLSGDVNWKAVAQAMKDIGYDDVLTAELSPYALSPKALPEDTSRHMDYIMNSVNE
ncbi:sugar phosphate isomerase/epimerase [Bacillaceae bacterium SIJ1]|uniref:sugar phosphate isomerase/epimerase family protein n=1 Tax=Litoribacterium kuwaitense TaxID=1398745 RepID=UPI0013EB50A9|nr:sugar phosphate isomerase/epimerase family protein [Litoribacterium kuwaitense]NGP45942.1 sugar phosphate isomerase/epimerase [Litoribacterium kuwaitense]